MGPPLTCKRDKRVPAYRPLIAVRGGARLYIYNAGKTGTRLSRLLAKGCASEPRPTDDLSTGGTTLLTRLA